MRERLAVLSNDVESLDRVLERLGYDGDVKLMPRVPRITLFYRGEARQFLLAQLREHGTMTTRQTAENLVKVGGRDAENRRIMADIVQRLGKSRSRMNLVSARFFGQKVHLHKKSL